MKRKVMGMFAGFLAVMLVFTFLSRAADSMTVARVTTAKAERGKIPHQVTASGNVVQNREQAVSVLAGQVVKSIYVEEGQKVAKGDVLFEIDLESLKEQILLQKQEMKKAELQSKDKESSREAQEYKDSLTRNRAAEDYSVAAGKGNTAVSRAAAELSRAKKKLKTLEQSGGAAGGEDAVEAVLKQTCEQKQEEYEEAVAWLEELEKAVDAAVEKAIREAQAGTDTGSAMQTAVEWENLMAAQDDPAGEMQPAAETAPEPAAVDGGTQPPVDEMQEPTESETQLTVDEMQESAESGTQPPPDEMQEPTESETQPSADEMQEPTESETQEPSTGGAQDFPSDGGDEFIMGDDTQIVEPETEQDIWLLEQRIRRENQPLLDDAKKQIDLKEQEKKEADAALASYQQEKAAGTQTSVEEMKQQIKEEIRTRQQAYEDAVTAANDSLRSAGRAIEDADAPQGTDSTGEIDAITREQEELKLGKLERLLKAGGKVTAPIDAVITKINLITGERTPDGTAMLMSDTAAGNKLVVQVPKDQEKYIARGDDVKVKENSKEGKELEGLAVDNVRANEENKELLEVTVQLPQDSFEAGVSVTMTATRTSETYDCCIPIQALYEENGKYFVYVTQERSSVMGTELTAVKLNVTVLDKNETKAALLQGSVSSDQYVIVSSDKAVTDGSRVRLKEG